MLPFILYPTTILITCFTAPPQIGVIEAFSHTVAPLFFLSSYIKNFKTYSVLKITLAIFRWCTVISNTQICTSMEILLPNCCFLLYDALNDFHHHMKRQGIPLSQVKVNQFLILCYAMQVYIIFQINPDIN